MDRYDVLVVMEKDKETGFFTQTVDSYKIGAGIELIETAYIAEEDGDYFIYLTFTTADVQEYQYYGIYDLYEEEVYDTFNIELLDGSGEYNPRWILKLKYSEERAEMERLINELVDTHKAELERIIPLVEAEKEKYLSESEKEE